jgi:hypothetical protein
MSEKYGHEGRLKTALMLLEGDDLLKISKGS